MDKKGPESILAYQMWHGRLRVHRLRALPHQYWGDLVEPFIHQTKPSTGSCQHTGTWRDIRSFMEKLSASLTSLSMASSLSLSSSTSPLALADLFAGLCNIFLMSWKPGLLVKCFSCRSLASLRCYSSSYPLGSLGGGGLVRSIWGCVQGRGKI